jgi:hypothetical protein
VQARADLCLPFARLRLVAPESPATATNLARSEPPSARERWQQRARSKEGSRGPRKRNK